MLYILQAVPELSMDTIITLAKTLGAAGTIFFGFATYMFYSRRIVTRGEHDEIVKEITARYDKVLDQKNNELINVRAALTRAEAATHGSFTISEGLLQALLSGAKSEKGQSGIPAGPK